MHRHALTDEQFAKLLPLLPAIPQKRGRGRPPKEARLVIDGILWILNTGAPWRDMPERFGPWNTVYGWFRKWTASGLWGQILEELRKGIPEAEPPAVVMFCVDGTNIRAHRAAAGASKKTGPVNLATMPLDAARAVLAPRSTLPAIIEVTFRACV